MTNEEKQLLLKDLCGRLPYGVMLDTPNGNKPLLALVSSKSYNTIIEYDDYHENEDDKSEWEGGDVELIKPYLRPMSSMTEEEFEDLNKQVGHKLERDKGEITNCSRGFGDGWECLDIIDMHNVIDWLNANCFDYRGLIPKGLALAAIDGMYNYKSQEYGQSRL